MESTNKTTLSSLWVNKTRSGSRRHGKWGQERGEASEEQQEIWNILGFIFTKTEMIIGTVERWTKTILWVLSLKELHFTKHLTSSLPGKEGNWYFSGLIIKIIVRIFLFLTLPELILFIRLRKQRQPGKCSQPIAYIHLPTETMGDLIASRGSWLAC